MAVLQTTYNAAPGFGYPGMIANGEPSNRISRTIEDATAVPFGRAVFQGTGDHGVTATPGTKFRGITIAHAGVVPTTISSVPDAYGQYGTAGLLNEGVIWVTAGANTTAGAAAYVTSGGAITPTSSSNTAIPATFEDTVTSGSPVRLRVIRA